VRLDTSNSPASPSDLGLSMFLPDKPTLDSQGPTSEVVPPIFELGASTSNIGKPTSEIGAPLFSLDPEPKT
jgi:hypothetical protein